MRRKVDGVTLVHHGLFIVPAAVVLPTLFLPVWLVFTIPMATAVTIWQAFRLDKIRARVRRCAVEGKCHRSDRSHRYFEKKLHAAFSEDSIFRVLFWIWMWGCVDAQLQFFEKEIAQNALRAWCEAFPAD